MEAWGTTFEIPEEDLQEIKEMKKAFQEDDNFEARRLPPASSDIEQLRQEMMVQFHLLQDKQVLGIYRKMKVLSEEVVRLAARADVMDEYKDKYTKMCNWSYFASCYLGEQGFIPKKNEPGPKHNLLELFTGGVVTPRSEAEMSAHRLGVAKVPHINRAGLKSRFPTQK